MLGRKKTIAISSAYHPGPPPTPATRTNIGGCSLRLRSGCHTALFFAPHRRRDTPAVAREESAKNCWTRMPFWRPYSHGSERDFHRHGPEVLLWEVSPDG